MYPDFFHWNYFDLKYIVQSMMEYLKAQKFNYSRNYTLVFYKKLRSDTPKKAFQRYTMDDDPVSAPRRSL